MAKHFDIVTLVMLVPHGDDSGIQTIVDMGLDNPSIICDVQVTETVTVAINDGIGAAWHLRTGRSPRIPEDAYA